MTQEIKIRMAEIKHSAKSWDIGFDYDHIVWLIDQLEQALAREDRYREALKKYGRHNFDCKHLGPNHECSCGYNEARQSSARGKK